MFCWKWFSNPTQVPPSAAVTAVAFLICFLPTSFKFAFVILLATFKAPWVSPCLAANETPPVIGAAKAAAIKVGSVSKSIEASFISSKYCYKLPISALVNLERKYL